MSDDKQELLSLCAILNSQPFGTLVSMQLGRVSLAQSYESGLIRQTPIITPDTSDSKQLSKTALLYFHSKQDIDTANETSHVFHLSALLQMTGDTLTERIAAWQSRVTEAERQLAAHQREIDDIAFRIYGISDEDRRAIETSITRNAPTAAEGEHTEDDDETESDQPTTDHRPPLPTTDH
jgi:hypothetical protein